MECYVSTFKMLGLLVMTCVMVAVCFFLTTLPKPTDQMIGWLGVFFFGLGFIALSVRMFHAKPQVVIDDDGIDDRRAKAGPIRWEEIRTISIRRVKSARFLCLELVEPEEYLSRLSTWKRRFASVNRSMGYLDVSIVFSGLSPGFDEALVYIQGRSAARGLIADANAS